LQAQAALRRQPSAPLPRRVRLAKRSYVGCWCALDDVSEENGTVYNLPYALVGTKDKIKHVKDEATNDMVGYFGSEPGTPVIAPAGSIAVFSSTCFHRNGFNRTEKTRRAYLV
jgi:ectoine hydroxylase-related dioxygenase (phytanoyl-CoA dioxygenase family)